MAEEGWRGSEGLEPDPLAEQLAPNGAVVLVGIMGSGPTEDDWYLFLNRELTRRAEFKASDVLHFEKIPEKDPPFLGTQGTRVYLRRDARLVYTTTQSRDVQAEFLTGDIGASLTPGAVMAGQRGAPGTPLLLPIVLGASFQPSCVTAPETCGLVESCYTPLCLQ